MASVSINLVALCLYYYVLIIHTVNSSPAGTLIVWLCLWGLDPLKTSQSWWLRRRNSFLPSCSLLPGRKLLLHGHLGRKEWNNSAMVGRGWLGLGLYLSTFIQLLLEWCSLQAPLTLSLSLTPAEDSNRICAHTLCLWLCTPTCCVGDVGWIWQLLKRTRHTPVIISETGTHTCTAL